MASPSAATALLLLLSLLAVAHCRVLDFEAEPAASSAVAVPDEQGPLNPAVPKEAGATEVVPAVHRIAAGEGFLRLPSHRRHRHPCRHGHALLHRNPWWARHHGIFLQDTYRFHRHGGGFPHLVHSRAHLAVGMPAELPHVEEPKDAEEEVKAVAEPDPDRSHPDTDGEQEIEEETKKPFHVVEEADDETARAWKREMWRRFRHGRHFHHRRFHHHRRHREDEEEGDHEQDEEGVGAMKLFHHNQDDEEEEMTRKPFHHHHHHHDSDSDNDEDDEAEEMARRWRKAIMRRRFHHGGRFHHHRRHQHVEETDEQEEEEGGVMKWFKDLMNRF